MTEIQKTLLLQIKEAAFDQPHPTDALRKTLLMYQGFEAGEAIRVKAIVAAKSRRYKARKTARITQSKTQSDTKADSKRLSQWHNQ